MMNVLNCLMISAQAVANQAIHAIWQAETQAEAKAEMAFEPKHPKAALYLQKDQEELIVFYGYPAQQW